MIQATQPTRQPMYERPPTRFEHRTTSKSAPSGNRSPTELVRSWEAFDRLFEDAFAPVNYPADSQAQSQSQSQTQSRAQSQYPEENRSQYTADNRSQYTADYRTQYTGDDDNRSQYTADNRTQTQSAYQTATPRAPHPRSRNLYDQTPSQGGRTQLYEQAQSQTGQTYLYEETPTQMGRTELYNEDENETAPSQTGQTYLYEETPAKSFSELSDLFDDRASGMTAETTKPIPGAYPKSFPQQQQYHRQQQTPPRQQYADEKTPHIRHTGLPPTDEPLSSVEADQDFQRLWSEAEANRRKRMTRTVTRRRILQHGVMSPGGTVSTMQTEPEHKLRRKKSRYVLSTLHALASPFRSCTLA